MVAGARNHLSANRSLEFRFEIRASNPCLVAVTFSPAVSDGSRHDALRKADATKTRTIDAPQADGWLKAPARHRLLANRSLQFSFESVFEASRARSAFDAWKPFGASDWRLADLCADPLCCPARTRDMATQEASVEATTQRGRPAVIAAARGCAASPVRPSLRSSASSITPTRPTGPSTTAWAPIGRSFSRGV